MRYARRGLLALTSAAAVTLAAMIVVAWPMGPVLWSLTAEHGMHAGDLLALAPGAVALGAAWRFMRAT